MVAVDRFGDVTVVWSDPDQFTTRVYGARFDASRGDWAPAERLSSSSAAAVRDAIATDDAGNVVALWRERDSDADDAPFSVRTARFDVDDGTWGPAQLLEVDDEATVLEASVTLDPSGGGFAMWISEGLRSREIHVSRMLAEAEVWGSAEVIVVDETLTARDLGVHSDDVGNAIAVWSQHDRDNERIVLASHYD